MRTHTVRTAASREGPSGLQQRHRVDRRRAGQAILAGRADTYINDVNTVDQAVKAYPDKLSKALAVTLPYYIGIGVPKGKTELRDAFVAALTALQESGAQLTLIKKWSLDAGSVAAPHLVTN